MAIQFARARYISRSTGGSAVRSAAYNGREAISAERTGELYYFRHRDAPEHHVVLLPEGAADRFAQAGVLWNAAEAAEKRKDAQVAREIVLALPADAAVSTEDRIALARSFAEQHFVSQGLAVQLDVHAPHGAAAESERANWHAHLLITTRRIEGEAFAAKKARDLDPEVRLAGGRARVADGAAWGALWREHQDRYFREHGIEARVDVPATHAQEHIGPVRMRRSGAEIVERAETIRQANQAAARDPVQVLATLTRNNATFSERDLTRFLSKQLGPESSDAAGEIAAVRAAVLSHADLVKLHERETGKAAGRFTTRQVRAEERAAMAAADSLARGRTDGVSTRAAQAATAERPLRPDQAAAFGHAIGDGGLKLIEGRAGTGKSYTLAAIRAAHARDGRRVVGLAPTNAVAHDLAADGFAESSTVHAALFKLKNGRTTWDRGTVVMVDEAAMLDTRVTGELLAAARQAGAKVILAGDDRQLASIERGGLFAELRQRHGAAAITEVTRQKVDWQRQAARDLAEGRFAEAVEAFDKAEAVNWTQTQDEARSALVAAWKRDAEDNPNASRFVFAYTNRDVDALNAELRQVRRERGALTGADVQLETKHGAASFAIGDRVQFTATDKTLRIYNGNAGTITAIDERTGSLTARLDAAGKEGREVVWSAAAFQGFRHGYAGTIYKGQGKTLDRTYLYHTEHWRAAASYVALTRQRESAQVFVARETARDAGQLARQMGRGEVRAASIAWATPEDLVARQTVREAVRRPAPKDRLNAKVRAALERWQRPAAARPAEPPTAMAREAMQVMARQMGRDELASMQHADRDVGSRYGRALTVQDVARRLDPAYAAAADRAGRLRDEARQLTQAMAAQDAAWRQGEAAGTQRWQEMGLLRQIAHKTRLGTDKLLAAHDANRDEAGVALETLEARRAELARALPEAEQAEAAAFAQVQPRAAAELAARRERASIARAVQAERDQQNRAAREPQERERGRDRDLGLER